MNLDWFTIPATAGGWAVIWSAAGYSLAHWLKTRVRMKELQDSADGSLRKDLMARIDRLEAMLEEERRECNRRIEALEIMAFGKGAASSLGQAAE